MRAGEFNTSVTIYKPETVGSEYSTNKRVRYIEVVTVRARKRHKAGALGVDALETFYRSSVVFSFRLHCKSLLRVGYRIVCDDENYRVVSIERNYKYNCLTVETERENG